MALERPTSEEGIANLALDRCGEDEIATFDDDLHRARVLRRQFPLVRDALLRRFDWNFASTWTAPAADAGSEGVHFDLRFPLPPECLAVREVLDAQDDEWEVVSSTVVIGGVEVEAMVLETSDTSPQVRFTKKVTAVRLWDPTFCDAFVCLLAAAAANQLGKSAAKARAWRAEAEDLLNPIAFRADSKEKAKSKQTPELIPWLAARRGFRRD